MTTCYFCGVSLTKGQGIRKNLRTGTSVTGFSSAAPSLLTIVLSGVIRGKPPSVRSYFSLRTLCSSCVQRMDARRALFNKIVMGAGGIVLTFLMLAFFR